MNKKFVLSCFLLALLAFLIPVEHKYDKLFRFYSLTLIPQDLLLSRGYEKKLYFYISDLIALSLFFLGIFGMKFSLKKSFQSFLWPVFILSLVSIVFSPLHSYPVAYSRLLQLLTPILLSCFLSNDFSLGERKIITKTICSAVFIAGIIQAGIGISQYFHQGYLGLRVLGETTQHSIYFIENGSRWLFDQLLQKERGINIVIRAAGTFPHANVFGGFLIFPILSSYFLSVKKSSYFLFALPILLFALALSFSRAALLGWAAATLIWFFLLFLKEGISPLKKPLLAICVSLCAIIPLLFHQYAARGGILKNSTLSSSADSIRASHQNTALEIIQDRPILGLGFNQFSENGSKYFSKEASSEAEKTAPHNIFLFLACETGIFSLLFFLLFIFQIIIRSARSPLTLETVTFLSLFLSYLLIGFFDFYPILFQQGKLLLFLSSGLLALNTADYVEPICLRQKN